MTKDDSLYLLNEFITYVENDFASKRFSKFQNFDGVEVTVDRLDGATDGSLWGHLLCELYFADAEDSERESYDGGQPKGDARFMLSECAGSFEELKKDPNGAADTIASLCTGRNLKTAFISDRMEDGATDAFEWQIEYE
jgi:hypothetical protein